MSDDSADSDAPADVPPVNGDDERWLATAESTEVVSGAPRESHELENGRDQMQQSSSHALRAEQIAPIPSAMTEDVIPPVAESAQQDDVAVLRDFVTTLEGGLTKYDSAIDNNDDIPLPVNADTDN